MAELTTFIKIDRNILKWRWFKKPLTAHLFEYLLLKANIKQHDFENKVVKRGQLATSIATIAFDTGMTIQQVRTALNHLKSTNEITIETTSKFSIITIVNYGKYQNVTSTSTNNQQTTNKQLTNNQQTTNNNQRKKRMKRKKECKNEREGSEAPPENSHSEKRVFGSFKNVFLTTDEMLSLKEKYPATYTAKIERLSGYIVTSGNNYKSHYAVLLQWLAEDEQLDKKKGASYNINELENTFSCGPYDLDMKEIEKIK